MSSSESARQGVSNFALTTSSWLPGKYNAPTYSLGDAPFTAKLSSFIESSILTSSVTEVADLESWADAAAGARNRIAARAIPLKRRVVSVMNPPLVNAWGLYHGTWGRGNWGRRRFLSAYEQGIFLVRMGGTAAG